MTRSILILAAGAIASVAAPVCANGPGQSVPALARCLHDRAIVVANEGDADGARQTFLQAIALWRELGPGYDPHRATSMMQMASILQLQGHYATAIDNYERAFELLKNSLGEKHERTAAAMVRLAGAYAHAGQTAKATPMLKAALAPASGLSPSDRAIALNALGSEAGIHGDYKAAIDYYRDAEKAMGAETDHDPAYAAVLCNLAAVYIASEELDRAEPLLKKVRAIYEANLGPEHPRMANLLLQEGNLALHQHHFIEAEALLSQAYAIAQHDLPANSDELASQMMSLGLAYLKNSKLEEAESVLVPGLQIKKTVYPYPHRELAVALHRVAALRAAQHRDSEASKLFQQAIQTYEQALGPDNDELKLALNEYAQFARSIRDRRLAKDLERRAKAIHSFR
jgi:tetratricopeptide (TPR) repeat protein